MFWLVRRNLCILLMSFAVPELSAELDLGRLWELYFSCSSSWSSMARSHPSPCCPLHPSGSHHLPSSPSCAADEWIHRKQLDSVIVLWPEPFSWRTNKLHYHYLCIFTLQVIKDFCFSKKCLKIIKANNSTSFPDIPSHTWKLWFCFALN